MAGLVSRVVWIWPSWDADRASKSAGYELQTVELGWFSADEAHGGFCRCDVVPLDRGTGMSLHRCAYNNETADDDDEESALSPERCHVRATYTQESVRARTAASWPSAPARTTPTRRWSTATRRPTSNSTSSWRGSSASWPRCCGARRRQRALVGACW